MKYASDFRADARKALYGRWHVSALTAFTASLIGAKIVSGGGSGMGSGESSEDLSLENFFSRETLNLVAGVMAVFALLAVVGFIVSLIIGGAGKLGYARYNLHLIDGGNARFSDLFSQFHRLGAGFLMNLLMSLYLFFWSLLFVIPGIIKAFSYAMTPYILYEHPEYTPNDAITRSREMMRGNKFRLFCLQFSFIGWSILCSLPAVYALTAVLGGKVVFLPLLLVSLVGEQFLAAYMEAANAAFYREISGTGGYTGTYYADYTER